MCPLPEGGVVYLTEQNQAPSEDGQASALEIVVTPEMVAAGFQAVVAAGDAGDYMDREAVRVFEAMLAACEAPKLRVRVSDAVRYRSE